MAMLAEMSEEEGGVSAVITEDSDLLCYANVQSVLFKVDRCAPLHQPVLSKADRRITGL